MDTEPFDEHVEGLFCCGDEGYAVELGEGFSLL
jgi:hypothetical protein